MSIQQLFLYFDNTSAANFKQWAGGLSAQLDAAGWSKTTDTGQVDWTTNPAVPASGSYLYEIRRPASDPLQTGATAYYLKIEYGNISSAGVGLPAMRLSLGTATNGAGTLTGNVTAVQSKGTSSAIATGTTTYESNVFWDSSKLGIMMWRNYASPYVPWIFVIERTKNTDGSDSSDGVVLISTGTALCQSQVLVFGVGPANAVTIPTIGINGTATDSFNNGIPISPVFPDYGKFGNPLTALAGAQQADVVEGALITTTLYGNTRTYMATKSPNISRLGSAQNQSPLMRWD